MVVEAKSWHEKVISGSFKVTLKTNVGGFTEDREFLVEVKDMDHYDSQNYTHFNNTAPFFQSDKQVIV